MAASRRPPSDSAGASPSVSQKPAPVNAPVVAQASPTSPPAAAGLEPSGTAASRRKPAAPRSRSAAGTSADGKGTKGRKGTRSAPRPQVSAEQRHAMIAEAAYLRAERRGFTGGDSVSDWLAAEREVDELLGADVTNSAQ